MRAKRIIAGLGIGMLTLSGCGFQGLYSAPLPGGADLGDKPFTVVAYFDDALDLVPQSAVKVNDIAVGKVTKISLDDWSAKVTMQVNKSVDLPSNATAEIAQTSLLGEKYVSLDPPTTAPSSARLVNGARIKLDHTRSAAEVEQVLGALSLLLNEGGLRQIKVIGRELITALKGREPEIKDLLTQLNTFVGTLDNQKTDITGALDSINTLSITLNRQKKVLTDALDTYPAALRVLAQERTRLVTLLTSLSKLGTVATDVINKTQKNFVTTLKALEPTLEQLKLSGSDLPGALRIAGTFPFPLGTTRQLVKGDYANLDANLNLDVTDTLCGLLGACPGLKTTGAMVKPVATTKAGSSSTERSLQPMIIGTGR